MGRNAQYKLSIHLSGLANCVDTSLNFMNNNHQLFMYVYYPKYNRQENKLGRSWQTVYHIAETNVQVRFVCSVL